MIRIALAQINPVVGDLCGNSRKIKDYIKQADRMEADLVVFPELALTGYPPEDLLLNPHFIQDNLRELKKVSLSARKSALILGFVQRKEKGGLYNAAALIAKGRILGTYHKRLLPNYGVFDEKRYFQVGCGHLIFKLKGIDFAVNICEDIWEEKGPVREEACLGARVIVNISASPYHKGKLNLRRKLLGQRAKENSVFVFYCNLVGGQDELVFDGASLVINPEGKIESRGKQFEEDLILFDLSRQSIDKYAKRSSKFKPLLGGSKFKRIILPASLKASSRPVLPKREIKLLSQEEEIYQALVLGTRDYLSKNGFKKAAIGLSGGIDSSLVACVACDALGGENVYAVSMPSRYSSQATRADAKVLARNLGIKFLSIPIDGIFQAYLDSFKHIFKELKSDITEENIQARIRGNILMALSNKFGWLILNTGNKSEVSVGYCTLYGDMAGGFAVLKDVPKILVYRLAAWRNKIYVRDMIPRSVFKRPPSAELRPNQKDEDNLAPYRILDPILEEYVEKDKDCKEIVNSGFNEGIVKKIVRMVDRNEYKRRQAPPGIKITPRAFGRDRRFPITNRYIMKTQLNERQ